MKPKLFQYTYLGLMSLLVVAPTAHSALLSGEPQYTRNYHLSGSLMFYSSIDRAWEMIAKENHFSPSIVATKLRATQDFISLDDELANNARVPLIQKKDLNTKPTETQTPELREPASNQPTLSAITAQNESDSAKIAPARLRNSLPTSATPHPHRARILVVDAEALNFGRLIPLPNATATWIGLESKLESKASATGVINAPYPRTRSQRFIVNVDSYIPAIGYAVMGTVAIAPMYKAELVKPLVETLGINTFDKHIVIGKALDAKLRPVSNVKIELSQTDASVDYSMGWGVFAKNLHESGSAGDFVAVGLESSIQYFMPVEGTEEWPSTAIDLNGAPQVVSIALPRAEREFARTNILDGFILEKPEGLVNLTIGGQRGVYFPEDFGTTDTNSSNTLVENLFVRPSVDVFEVRAPSYMKTWVNNPATPALVSKFSPVLSEGQVQSILEPIGMNWSSAESIVLGRLNAKDYANKPMKIAVMGPNGRAATEATVIYFDARTQASLDVNTTEQNGRFMIVGLEAGEWNIVAIDPKSRTTQKANGTKVFHPAGLGSALIRTADGVLSYVEI